VAEVAVEITIQFFPATAMVRVVAVVAEFLPLAAL
jgi:hypothetical protein